MNKKLRFIFFIAMIISIMAISDFAFAQTGIVPENALVLTEQIIASSSDYGKISGSKNGLIESKSSQNYPIQDQNIKQQNDSSSRNTALALSVMSLFVSFISLIISVYLLLRMWKRD